MGEGATAGQLVLLLFIPVLWVLGIWVLLLSLKSNPIGIDEYTLLLLLSSNPDDRLKTNNCVPLVTNIFQLPGHGMLC